jgi:AraC-like DNA-binding protein
VQQTVRDFSKRDIAATNMAVTPSPEVHPISHFARYQTQRPGHAAGLTPMYFAAQFRARTGLRPHEYVMQQRVARAQVLLREPGSEIADIACSVGFANQAHFTTMFRRHLGITPHRWRVSQDLDISRFRPGNRSSEPQYSSAHYCVPPTKSAVDR